MAAIWNDIVIEWEGEHYTVRPTLKLINALEQGEGRSLSQMFIRLSRGDLPSSVACEVIARVLQYAGAEVTAEEVFHNTGGGINSVAVTTVMQILAALMPPVDIQTQTGKKKTTPTRTPKK
jgi:hypothetical protein